MKILCTYGLMFSKQHIIIYYELDDKRFLIISNNTVANKWYDAATFISVH